MPDLRQGGCLCGAARYEVNLDGHKTGNCHCVDCQKNSGAAFMPFSNIDSGQFRWLKKPEGVYRSSERALRTFCTQCGTPLTWEALSRPERQSISIGTLDDTKDIEISYEIFTQTRLADIQPVSGARQYPADNE